MKEISAEIPDVGVGKVNVVSKFNRVERMANANDRLFEGMLAENPSDTAWKMARKSVMAAPCCAICNKTGYDMNVEDPIEWRCCTRCHNGWACCAAHHREYMESNHTTEVCEKYIECSKIDLFRYKHTIDHGDRFMFMPEEALTAPMRSFPSTWVEYFKARCQNEYSMRRHLPQEFFPVSTFLLSQVNTILYGMYLHDKDHFTNLHELTVHVLGPSDGFEYEGGAPTCVWEEIMHCLPAVKTLKVIYIGPEGRLNFGLSSIEACPDCTAKGRVRMQGFHDMTYHEYYTSDDFVKPDFVAAYNTGMYDEYTQEWKDSLKVLLDLDVPCIFTSYNELEGVEDLKVLREVGAKTLTETTMLNPFQVMVPYIDDNFIDKFFYSNMYYICFRGRAN